MYDLPRLEAEPVSSVARWILTADHQGSPACLLSTKVQYLLTTFFFWCKIYVQWNVHILTVHLLSFENICDLHLYGVMGCSHHPQSSFMSLLNQSDFQQRKQLLIFPPPYSRLAYSRTIHKWNPATVLFEKGFSTQHVFKSLHSCFIDW